MKKLLVFVFAFTPTLAFSVPSVRVLGNSATSKAVVSSESKVTPKKTNTTSSVAGTARIGTLRTKKQTVSASGAITNSNTRFPVITAAQSYNSVSKPKENTSNESYYGGSSSAGVDVDVIVNAVTKNIEQNYYNKDDVYNNNQFVEAVRSVKSVDDPRIDAIKIGVPQHSTDLPNNYVYIWIEE